jgi:small subunit ribosomal protein S8e
MQWHGRSLRKPSGGRLRTARKKRKYEFGTDPILSQIGKEKRKLMRTRGGNQKTRVIATTVANLTDPKTGKTQQSEIKDVLENTANPNYVRRDIITKGCIVLTENGKARVTSRPGQDGIINAVLLNDGQKTG